MNTIKEVEERSDSSVYEEFDDLKEVSIVDQLPSK